MSHQPIFTFRKSFFFLALAMFAIETYIAIYVHDHFVRPYLGDYLVVFLIYWAMRSVLCVSERKLAFAVLLFAYSVETLQYIHIIDRLGISDSKLAQTVIGVGFEWKDMLAYTLAYLSLLIGIKFFSLKR
jgi:hypothetical protein